MEESGFERCSSLGWGTDGAPGSSRYAAGVVETSESSRLPRVAIAVPIRELLELALERLDLAGPGRTRLIVEARTAEA